MTRSVPRSRFVSPSILLVGITVGFVACSVAGWVASLRNPYRHFVRFHQMLSAGGSYQPTVSHIRALVDASAPPGSIPVLVGGSSIMFGFSQDAARLWTKRLQERLGPPYRVLNLALPGGVFTEGAALAAESLVKAGAPVLLVADLPPGLPSSPLGRIYGYMFWDAYYKNMLLDDALRAARVQALLTEMDAATRRTVHERRLGAALDSVLRFNELWTFLAYRRFFTVWTFMADGAPFRARRNLPDGDPGPAPFTRRYPPAARENAIEIVRDIIARRITFGSDGRRVYGEAPRPWEWIRRDLETSLPAAVRQRALIVVVPPSPYYVALLPTEEQQQLALVVQQTVAVLESAGYEAASLGPDLTAEDFGDLSHLTPSGGAKLADLLAPRIRAMAARMGYGS